MFEQPYHDDDLIRRSEWRFKPRSWSHNTGADERHDRESGPRQWNIRPALERFINRNGQEQAARFYGESITCVGKEYSGIANSNGATVCLLIQYQQYAYSVTAVHFLAVCYYAMNYGGDEPFRNMAQTVAKTGIVPHCLFHQGTSSEVGWPLNIRDILSICAAVAVWGRSSS